MDDDDAPEVELLRDFRVPSAPRDPQASVRGRAAFVHHLRAGRAPAPGPRRPATWAVAAAVAAVLAVVAGAAVVQAVPGRGGPSDAPLAAPGTGSGPVQAGRPLCADLDPPALRGRDIWVSPDGDDARTGATEAEALADPQVAVDRAGPGDRVLLASGVYTSDRSAVIEISGSGEAGREIVVAAAPGARPVVRAGAATWNAVRVTGSFVVVSGLVLEGHRAGIDLDTAIALADVDDPRTAGNGITVGAAAGGDEPYPHGVVVRGTVVRDFPGGGIAAQRTGSVTIECNAVSGNGTLSPFANSGISVSGSRSTPTDPGALVVRRNVTHHNDARVPRRGSADDPGARTVGGGHGISCEGVDAAAWSGTLVVESNLAYANGGSGVNVDRCDRTTVRHTTAVGNGTRAGSGSGEVTVRRSAGVRLVDNLVVPTAGGPGTASAEPVGEDGTVDLGGTDPAAVFVDVAAGDYRLRCDSPAVDRAGTASVPDLFGTPRPAGPAADAGAVESC